MPKPENTAGGAMPADRSDIHLQRLITPQDLNLPWYRSLLGNLREAFHPPKLPPLDVTSQPVNVKDIWGLYGRQKKSFAMSVGFQAAVVAVLFTVLSNGHAIVKGIEKSAVIFLPDNLLPQSLVPRPNRGAGGGGGGDRSTLRAAQGNPPPAKRREFVPPHEVYNNLNPIISMDQSVQGDTISLVSMNQRIGDPFAPDGPLSNGPGHSGGIGSGDGGGDGSGHGPGVGPGSKGGSGGGEFGGPVFTPGAAGLTNPIAIFKPEPDYSDDARKAKLQGTVVLGVVVDQNGQSHVQKVLQSLGLGLDEKAIKTVTTWRFKPGTKNGKPVPVQIQVWVSFRLL